MILPAGRGRPEAAVSPLSSTLEPDALSEWTECASTHIEAISAIETMTKPMHKAVTRNVTIAPPVPPLVNGMINVL